MRVRMGTAQYYSKRSYSSHGDWNEGFLFTLSYHAQLFDTIDFDIYDKPHKHLPGTTKHLGKAKLKISTLKGKDDVFITFLPIYEYQRNRLLPSDVISLLQTDLVDPRVVSEKVGDLPLIGSLQLRIKYRYQDPFCTKEATLSTDEILTDSSSSSHLNIPSPTEPDPQNPQNDIRRTSYGRGDLARDEDYIDDLFIMNLSVAMAEPIPNSTTTSTRSSSISNGYEPSLKSTIKQSFSFQNTSSSFIAQPDKLAERLHDIIHPADKIPQSSRGHRFGFSQHDSDTSQQFNPDDNGQFPTHLNESISSLPEFSTGNKKEDSFHPKQSLKKAKKKAQYVIDGVNFGDRNFASQWMHDSFDDVAVSHPLLDKLVGSVVSKQTRTLIRAIIKTANSFGQGFRVTGIDLFKAALLIQQFYSSLPVEIPPNKVNDIHLINNASHYFPFALIAYGWRGLCYLGAYGQYLRGGKDRRSNRIAILNYLSINPEDLLGYEYSLRKGASFQPSYFIAIDRSRKAIVLSIRGTWSLYDAITDLVCEYRPWKGGLVHSGMLASAQWFYTNILPQIFRYVHHYSNVITNLIITGHSLGGGTASILTMMAADHINRLKSLACNPSFDLHCYTYAPAAVVTRDLSKRYEQYIHSFVCHDDIVGRLSYGTAMKFKELTLDTISTFKTLGGFRKIMSDQKTRDLCFEIIKARSLQLNSPKYSLYPSLYIPGIIVHIKRLKESQLHPSNKSPNTSKDSDNEDKSPHRDSVKESVYKHIPGKSKCKHIAYYSNQDMSDEMVLTKTCIEDHMITAYNNTFEALKSELPLI
ncbi:hypothetical protein BDB01DRAFT_832360 [Pilobolus umbonatus]|nr:hypothetical protein BDB01DRAFT_832360 [Pilobolus umbonatus]